MTTNPKLQEIAEKWACTLWFPDKNLRDVVKESIEQALTEYSAELEKSCIEWATSHGKLQAEHLKVTEERDSSLDMLQLILPMAKGYAAEHQVGNNQKFVEMAEKLLLDTHESVPQFQRQ